ncbi:putative tetratricopeptide repeat protein 41 [Hypanus sabinus]|uniref:putative tetratricopeptide repeat protein 41 n=1 Tax=Hypanus sabinus TaxID=79690 RepID=UPI0028C3BEF2|nr:putative tetratricopeptide repeat protein 41 [Hypanus sabinus]XP_059833607.1 putative tetratricopeptide repeat protein 41 [Hypanus sabinus]XP_059833608.1 putative tetratricopeptide repeat protein 41 [Hypanus sabinus]
MVRSYERERNEYLTQNPECIYRPPIEVLLCSTLEDFQKERNYLEKNVFPILSELCKTRRSCFKVVDVQQTLHEGHHDLNTDSLQLKITLDYITKHSPSLICLLGERYGEYCTTSFSVGGSDVAGLSKLERNLYIAAKNGYPWILVENYRTCSLMELEIIEAAFLNDSQFSFFYIRDPQYLDDLLLSVPQYERWKVDHTYKSRDYYEERKVWELKEKIISKGLPVKFFRRIEELGEAVLKDWRGAIDKLYPMDLVPLNTDHESYLELSYHEAFAQRYCKVFVENAETQRIFGILDAFAFIPPKDDEIEENSKLTHFKYCCNSSSTEPRANVTVNCKSLLLLYGETGCGKTAIICNWLKYFRMKNPSILVLSHYVGCSSASYDIMSFMRRCILKLRFEYCGAEDHPSAFSENPTDTCLFQMIREAFVASIGLKPCVLVIDGADRLSGTRGLTAQQVKEFSWIPQLLPAECRLIVTTVSSNISYVSLKKHPDVKVVHISSTPDYKAKVCILQKHLARPHKEVSESQIQNIMSRKLCSFPLVLVILANELRVCGPFRNETECLDEYLECQTIQELWTAVLRRWIEDYGWTSNTVTTCSGKNTSPSNLPNSSSSGMSGWVVDTLCLLSISRCGLTEEDIHQLLRCLGYNGADKVSSYDWNLFRAASIEWIQERPDGLLNFTHHSVQDAVGYFLLGAIAPIKESTLKSPLNNKRSRIHQLFQEYLSQQAYTLKLYQELPWQLKMSGNLSDLCAIVANPTIMHVICQNAKHSYQSKLELLCYWDGLSKTGFDPAVTYHNMVNQLVATSNLSADIDSDSQMARYNNCTQAALVCFTAEFLKDLDKVTTSEELLLIALSLLPMSCPLDLMETEVYFKVHYNIGDVYLNAGKLQDAEKHFQKALHSIDFASKEIRKCLPETVSCSVQLLCKLASLKMCEGSPRVDDLLQKTKKETRKVHNPCGEANLKILEGFQQIHVGKFSVAEQCFQEALNIKQKWYGELHPLVGEILEHLGDLLSCSEKSESFDRSQAEEIYRQVIKIQEENMRLATSLRIRDQINLNRALAIFKLGKLLQNDVSYRAKKRAVECLRQSFDLLTKMLGSSHHLTMEVRRLLKSSELQIHKDFTFFKRPAASNPGNSLSVPTSKENGLTSSRFTYKQLQAPKNNLKSGLSAGKHHTSSQTVTSLKPAETIDKTQRDVCSNLRADVLCEQDRKDAILEQENLVNSRLASNVHICKRDLPPRPSSLMVRQGNRYPPMNRNSSAFANTRAKSSSVCRPLMTCKQSTFECGINILVPPSRTKVASEKIICLASFILAASNSPKPSLPQKTWD